MYFKSLCHQTLELNVRLMSTNCINYRRFCGHSELCHINDIDIDNIVVLMIFSKTMMVIRQYSNSVSAVASCGIKIDIK